MDFRKRIGKPIRIPAQGNMRRDFTFAQQQPSSVIDLAKNIISITPRKNRPSNADIVSFVTESLVKQEEMVKEEPEFVMNYNPTYAREQPRLYEPFESTMGREANVGTEGSYPSFPFQMTPSVVQSSAIARLVQGRNMLTQTVQTGEEGFSASQGARTEFRSGGFRGSGSSVFMLRPDLVQSMTQSLEETPARPRPGT
jgi:hypothetical protein